MSRVRWEGALSYRLCRERVGGNGRDGESSRLGGMGMGEEGWVVVGVGSSETKEG